MLTDTEMTFEEAYGRLEELILRLDEGGLSLEEAITCYEEASGLVARCNSVLDAAELRLRTVEEANGASEASGAATGSADEADEDDIPF